VALYAMIKPVGPAGAADRADGVTRPDKGGVVARTQLFARLSGSARVTAISAPPGSGKTVLLRSWIAEAGSQLDAAWVAVGHEGRDQQRFWLSVVGALSRTRSGSAVVRALTPAPDLDGWRIVEQLLTDLASLEDPLWLVIDDVHALGEGETLRQLELLVMRAPPHLRFVLATRHDLRLGLHRLRLAGELTEIRAADLRFTRAEARAMLETAGVELAEPALALLHQRTEGWAAGLRLAALALAGHPDPERFAAEFSGSERTVAEYLLAEVLEGQSPPVRRLLLRTSILERVSGELADLLTGEIGGERTLQDLQQANAFVVSLDPARSWFRYHQMFAGFLQLELRRTAPGEMTALHRTASRWLASHGHPVEAIRHAQAAQDWDLAAQLLAGHWPGLQLDGQAAASHELLTRFPAEIRAADAELAAVAAADELARGSLEAAQGYLDVAERGSAAVAPERRGQLRLLLGVVRLLLARQRGNLPAVVDQAQRLQALAETPDATRSGLGEDLRALALINLGIAQLWAARFEDAARHLEQGIGLARWVGRPYLEFTGLAYLALSGIDGSFDRAAERCEQAIELARRHGWSDEPAAGIAYVTIGVGFAWQGRLVEAESWVYRAERTLRAETEPIAALGIRYVRGLLELARGRYAAAVAALRAAEPPAGGFAAPPYLVPPTRALLLLALVRLGQTERAERTLAELSDQDRARAEITLAAAALRLAQGDPHAAAAALASVADGSARFVGLFRNSWRAQFYLLEARTREALGDPGAAERALEQALDLAEPTNALSAFLLHPVPDLLERQGGHRTSHAALVAEILSLLAACGSASPSAAPPPVHEPLSHSELRVLRYLPTNLSAAEIARQLYVSPNTVKTHIRNIYAKFGIHRRAEAVARARALGLLAPSARHR
jgi:LuxR family maltose regulon positive regulatory protein